LLDDCAVTRRLPTIFRERNVAASEGAAPAEDTQVEAQIEAEADQREELQAA